MNDPDCQRYLEDPEANASHLERCAECRAMDSGLRDVAAGPPVAVNPEALPLAPWEGAAYRSWPLVAGGALTVLALAIAFGLLSGVSPMRVVDSGLLSVDGARAFILTSAASLRRASVAGQIGFAFLFLAVNALLFILLRRAPRGFDV